MSVVLGVAVALGATATACLDAGQEKGAHNLQVGPTRAAQYAGSDIAEVGAIKVEADASPQFGHIVFG